MQAVVDNVFDDVIDTRSIGACYCTTTSNIACMSGRRVTSYQRLQISLACADLMLAVSGPLVSATVTGLFLTRDLGPGHFLTSDLFHQFQFAAEAVSAGLDHVIRTDLWWLVAAGAGLATSTTVSIATIATMATLRWAVTGSQNNVIEFIEKHVTAIIAVIWIAGGKKIDKDR